MRPKSHINGLWLIHEILLRIYLEYRSDRFNLFAISHGAIVWPPRVGDRTLPTYQTVGAAPIPRAFSQRETAAVLHTNRKRVVRLIERGELQLDPAGHISRESLEAHAGRTIPRQEFEAALASVHWRKRP
jgi:hypothetical protein